MDLVSETAAGILKLSADSLALSLRFQFAEGGLSSRICKTMRVSGDLHLQRVLLSWLGASTLGGFTMI